MSIFIFLATLAAFTVLLGDVAGTVVITAPSSVIERTSELETREQGPTAWICSALVVESPWTAYANIRGYLEGGNTQGKNYTELVLYPVMELFHATQDRSRLCVYLPAEDHCYPPAPSTGAVKAVKQLTKRIYFAIRFWGQASNARVQYYKQKLTKALTTYNKAAMLDLFFVSFFSDHVREVRYDSATAGTEPSNDLTPTKSLSVPVTSEVPVVSTTVPADKTPGGLCPAIVRNMTLLDGVDKSVRMLVSHGRLAMPDVETVIADNIKNADVCKTVSYIKVADAFTFEKPKCFLYYFGKDFCPCKGSREIFVLRKRLENNEVRRAILPHPNYALDEIVMYNEIPASKFQAQLLDQSLASNTPYCEKALQTPGKKPSMSAIIYNGRCYTSNIHDAVNCNQPCVGEPGRALVRKINPNPIVHFLSNCGQKLQVTAKSEKESSIYLSHPGIGCYYYPDVKFLKEGDCIITFEKAPTAQALEVVFDYVNLDRPSSGCQDTLILYAGCSISSLGYLKSICNGEGQQRVSVNEAVTINFYRIHKSIGSGKFGFRLSIFNV